MCHIRSTPRERRKIVFPRDGESGRRYRVARADAAEEPVHVRRGIQCCSLPRPFGFSLEQTIWVSVRVYPRCCIRLCSAMVRIPHRLILPSLPTVEYGHVTFKHLIQRNPRSPPCGQPHPGTNPTTEIA